MPGARRKRNQIQPCVQEAFADNPQRGHEHDGAEREAPSTRVVDSPVDQEHRHQADAHREELRLPRRHRRIQIHGVVREPDGPRRHEQRHRRHHGPEKEEAHQTAGPVRTVRFEEILVAAAGPRHGGAEFGPHQPIGDRDHRPDQPAQHRLRSVHRLQQQRNRQEWSGADHRDDVGRRRGGEPHPALETGRRGSERVAHCTEVGAVRFSSSNQFSTRLMLVAGCGASTG